MEIIIKILAIGMGLLGVLVLWSGIGSKHRGLMVGGIVYLAGSYIAIYTESFLPLVIAFIITLILRKIGFDPSR